MQRYIELGLADIDASANRATIAHLRRSSLGYEPDVHSTMRASMKMPIVILLRRAAQHASMGYDPTIGGPAWVATWAGPFLPERSRLSRSC
jgi:hypothetical protein